MISYVDKCRSGKGYWPLQYVYNIGVMLSQNLSVILGGDPDETVCSRAGKAARAGRWWAVHMLVPFLNWFMHEENHCAKVIEDDEGKKAVWDWSK